MYFYACLIGTLTIIPFTSVLPRLMFGTTQLYVFVNPKERDSSGEKYEVPSFEMAQEEIAASSGFDMNTDNKSQGMWYNGSEQQILGSLTFPLLELYIGPSTRMQRYLITKSARAF